jgi:hypothetical protein
LYFVQFWRRVFIAYRQKKEVVSEIIFRSLHQGCNSCLTKTGAILGNSWAGSTWSARRGCSLDLRAGTQAVLRSTVLTVQAATPGSHIVAESA